MTTTTTQTLPTTLEQISACAASMFSDPAVHSVNVSATWGEVTVHRNGNITPSEHADPITDHPQAKAVARLLQSMLLAGFELHSIDDGGEAFALTSHDIKTAVETITSVDTSELVITNPDDTKRHWVLIVLGNANSEMVSDYSGQENDLIDRTINAFADREADRE